MLMILTQEIQQIKLIRQRWWKNWLSGL